MKQQVAEISLTNHGLSWLHLWEAPQTPPVSSQASPSQPHLQQPPKLGYSRPGPGWVVTSFIAQVGRR